MKIKGAAITTSSGCILLDDIPEYVVCKNHSSSNTGIILGINLAPRAPSSLVDVEIGTVRLYDSISSKKKYVLKHLFN